MRNIVFVLMIFSLFHLNHNIIFAGSAGKNYTYETQEIVLFPTAGLVTQNDIFNIKFLGRDVIVLSMEKITNNDLVVGVSLAFEDFLGNRQISFLDYPAVKIKYRLLNEAKYYPAIVVGFDSENFLDIIVNTNNYYHHSIGPYIVASKAFSWQLGILGIHFGANLPIEFNVSKRGNFFFGIEHSIHHNASATIEYNFNGSYNKEGSIQKGLLNMGLKYSIDRNVTINFYMIDLLTTNFNRYKILNFQFITKLF